MIKYLFIAMALLLSWSCNNNETCNECDLALLDYFNAMGNSCSGDEAAVQNNCSNFVAFQGIGVMRESCLQGNAEQAFCNNVGRSAAPFDLKQWQPVAEAVRVEISYGGHTEEITVDNTTFVRRVFDGFLPANVLVDVKMYDTTTGELLVSATPKITYDRVEDNLDEVREIQVDKVNDDWRLYFFFWE